MGLSRPTPSSIIDGFCRVADLESAKKKEDFGSDVV